MVAVIAHWGFAGRAPENTVAALADALETSADVVELDVRPAADGHPSSSTTTASRATNLATVVC